MTSTDSGAKPSVSIITVSDYKTGDPSSMKALQLTLAGLAKQDYDGSVEYILVEAEDSLNQVPDDISEVLPELRVVIGDQGPTSYDLKNAGAQAASSDFVVMLDADCAPHPKWLSSLMGHRQRHPNAAAISGRTMYKKQGVLPNIFALLDRGYVDCGGPGECGAISNNNGAFSREILLKFPLENDVGPFGSKPHSDQIKADGGELRFEPGMVVYHGYGAWPMAKEIREFTGYAMARYRKINPNAKYGWLYRLGPVAIPVIFAMGLLDSWISILKLYPHYDLKWYNVPYAFYVAFRAQLLEIPGLVKGMREEPMDFADVYR